MKAACVALVLLVGHGDGFGLKPRSSGLHGPLSLSRSRRGLLKTDIPQQTNSNPKGADGFFPLQLPVSFPSPQQASTQAQQVLKADARQEWVARGILLMVSAFYGTNFGCVKILDQALDPSMAATFRFSLAATVFAPFLATCISQNPRLVMGGLEVGVYLFFGYWAQAHALLTSSASTAAFICSLAVVVVPLLDAVAGKKNKNYANAPWYAPLFPAALAAAGVGCLELGGTSVPGVGDLWAVVQPLMFGLGFWRVESHMKDAKAPGEAQAFTGAMMLTVAAFSWVWALFDYVLPAASASALNADGSAVSSLALVVAAVQSQVAQVGDWHVALAIIWTGVVTTALTSFGENMAMKSLSSAETTVIFSTEPLWGTAFAAVALGEAVGSEVFVGAALILSACVWSSLGPSLSFPLPASSAASASASGSAAAAVAAASAEESKGLVGLAEEVGANLARNWDVISNSGVESGLLDEL